MGDRCISRAMIGFSASNFAVSLRGCGYLCCLRCHILCAVSGGDLQCISDDGEGEVEKVADTPLAGLSLSVQTACYQPSTQVYIITC